MSLPSEKSIMDLADPKYYENPYPVYERLRAERPVYWIPELGAWFVARYSDVVSALRDSRFTQDRYRIGFALMSPEERAEHEPFQKKFGMWLLFKDGAAHTSLRRTMTAGFSAKSVEALADIIKLTAHRLIDAFKDRGSAELVSEYADALPVAIIARMLGIHERITDKRLVELTASIVSAISMPISSPQARQAMADFLELEAVFLEAIRARRAAPIKNEVLSLLVQEQGVDGLVTDEELCSQCIMLSFGGHETTKNLIGNGLVSLFHNRSQLDLFVERKDLRENAIEELLRYDSPVHVTLRRLNSDVDLHGITMKSGDFVYLGLASANRDPDVFARPDELDIERPEARRHLSFGHGAHYCLGASLARVEARTAIEALLDRLPTLRISTSSLEWLPNPAFHGVARLPAAF